MTKDTKPMDTAKKIGLEILESFSPLKEELSWVISSSVIINLLALATPLVMLQVFDRIIAKGSMDTLALIMFGATVAVGLEALLRIVRSHLSAWIAARFEHKAMINTVSRMLGMPLHQFELSGTGAHNDHIKAIQSLKSFYSGQTFQHMLDIPFTLLYVVVMAFISPWIALLVIVGYAAFTYFVWQTGLNHGKLVKDRSMSDLRRTNFLAETLGNIHTLKSMSMEALMLRRYERLQETSAHVMQKLTYALDIAQGIGSVFSPLMSALVITLGAYLVITGHMTTGELAAVILLSGRSLAPIQRLGGIWARHQQEEIMRADLAKLISLPELPKENPSDESSTNGSIELKNVSYQFPGVTEPIFKNISLKINQGECVFINGANGSGRTTLLQLIGGLIKPTNGEVILGNHNLKDKGENYLKQSVAYLPQRTQLFEGTLIENISVFDPKLADSALEKAQTLQIGSFVSKLPRGWDSQVGDGASESMPPGFRQRIAIVRALANNPQIILFDDATASIDSEGEKFVLEYLNSIKGKVTLILVTQRPSLQKMADRIVTLKDGTLLDGLHDVSIDNAQLSAANDNLQDSSGQSQTGTGPSNFSWERTHQAVVANFNKPNHLATAFPVLLREMGIKRSSRDVTETLPYFTDSLTITGYENAMAQLGYKAYNTDCSLGSLDARMLPCLFITTDGNAFTVIERRGDALIIADNAIEKPIKETNLRLFGRAYFFIKQINKPNAQQTSWVKKALIRFRPLIVQAGASSMISGVVMVIGSMFMMAVYNSVIPSGSLKILFYLSFGVLLSLWVGWLLMKHRADILAYISGRIEYLFGTTILQQILSLSPSMTERSAVSAQMARLSAFEAIRDLFTGPIAATVLESPATIIVLIALGIINPPSLIIFLIVLAIYGLLYWLLAPYTARSVAEVSQTSTKRNEFLIEMISKMRTIRESGGTNTWLERYRKVSSEATMASYKAERLSQTLVGLSYFVMMFAGLMIVTVTVPLTLTQTLGPGALIASMFLMWRILGPIQTLFTNLTRIERVKSAVKQLENLMQIKGERLETAASPISRGLKGKVQFSRVSFRYSLNVDPALVGVEFNINPGEVIAITGPNGGGKSTLLKLIMGMYQPQAGSILIDGVDIRQLDPIELRRLVGYAPQDTQFFRATLSQNLRLARPDATDDELKEALRKAGALEQVLDLPKGLEYRIGDNASEQLPASLRQKLTLARAYLTEAPIMLFDEPGAGLDALGDRKFMEALENFRGKTTVFFISHRPSHIKLADTVIVLEQGYVRAAGKPQDLFKTPSAA
jgi:ATP-binding cassette, subfamily C, bacterial LapB